MSNKPKRKKTPVVYVPPTESPWPKRVVWIIGGSVVLALVAVVFFSQPELRGVPDGTETVAVADPLHVEGDLHEDAEVPAGGPHDAAWQNCGYYSVEIRSENAVHSLEHGAVWISYDPTLPQDVVDSLRGFVSRSEKVLVSPIPGQEAPIIVTAWGQQLEIHDPTDTRLGQFVNEFSGSASAPEPGGACRGGVGVPTF